MRNPYIDKHRNAINEAVIPDFPPDSVEGSLKNRVNTLEREVKDLKYQMQTIIARLQDFMYDRIR